MFRILKKEALNPTVSRMVIEAPLIAKKAQAGQFIILRADEEGERIPSPLRITTARQARLPLYIRS